MSIFFKDKKIQIDIDEALLCDVKDRVVLVTGGAGFVGTKLVRQIAKLGPSKLIVFDLNEEKLAKLQADLSSEFDMINFVFLLGSTSDIDRINEIFKEYKPEVIFHAATYKNGVLLESSPGEAVKNNVLGTYNVAHAAKQNKSISFAFVSTFGDIEPTCVMNSSMLIAEMLVFGANHYKDETVCKIICLDENNRLSLKNCQFKFSIDDFTFKLQSLVIAARTNDDNKTKDYLRIALKK